MATTKDSSHSTKSELAKKLELIKELQQLRIKEQNVEKEKIAQVYERHGEFHTEFNTLQELDMKTKTERNAEAVKMRQQYNKIKNMVRKFQLELQNMQPSAQFVEKLKVIMEDIENNITLFKEQQRNEFEHLLRDERTVGLELLALDKHIESWSSQPSFDAPCGGISMKSRSTHAAVSSARDVMADLPPEVAAFERFLQLKGGHNGGWDEYDHTTFLKFRNRFKGKVSFIKELIGFLPTRTEDELRDHEVWYQEYVTLIERKKEAIQKWRERKEIEKEDLVAKAEKLDQEKKDEAEAEEKKRKAFQKEKEEQRMLLNRWKIEKDLQKAEEEERRLHEELERQKRDDVERQKKMLLKRKVDEFKAEKEKEEVEKRMEEMLKLQLEKEERHREATILISKYRDRDLGAVKQKREKEEREKRRKDQEKQERLEKIKSLVEVTANRDPERLFRPTEVWNERQKDTEPSSRWGPQLHIPHRAVPTWRQGLS